MVGSGYREPPALARRNDGQTFQLTAAALPRAGHGRRPPRPTTRSAERVSAAYGRTVTGDNVRSLVDEQLRPLGLLAKEDGSQPEVKKSNPLLALRFKYAVTDPERTRRLTAPFARLFNPVVVALVMAAFLAVCWWVFLREGPGLGDVRGLRQARAAAARRRGHVLSAGFHEFGHAAAARRGGATPGRDGRRALPRLAGVLHRRHRLLPARPRRPGAHRPRRPVLQRDRRRRASPGVWWATGYDALLLVVATQILQMVRQLTPLVRFDGYHVLADVTGVPDLFHRIKPTLLGLLPWRWSDPEASMLKPWARAVVTVWVLVVVPMLAFSLFTMVDHAPPAARHGLGRGDVMTIVKHDVGTTTSTQTVTTARADARLGVLPAPRPRRAG